MIPASERLYRERFETPSGRAQLDDGPLRAAGRAARRRVPAPARHRPAARALQRGHDDPAHRATSSSSPRSCSSCTPTTPRALGVGDGERVRVASRRGEIEVTADVTERVSPGQAFIGFHFPEALANRLTSQHGDEVTSCPEYKVTAVPRRERRDERRRSHRRRGAPPSRSVAPPTAPASTRCCLRRSPSEGGRRRGREGRDGGAADVRARGARRRLHRLGAMFATTAVAGAGDVLPFGVAAAARRPRLLPRPDPRRRRRAPSCSPATT